MRIHLPRAAVVAAIGCLALAGCGVGVTPHTYTGSTSCPNLDPVAQKYMQGSESMPVRCGPQKIDYADPSITPTGEKMTP
ncbi:hypothetical protein [Acidimangrovimonas pyrenivorans]|uniref:Lipoprotein n=1 Tax=Acidimangrovimonas pyrenivorans TaxID=2030798 RepID=A0ABV7AMR5_9RHOB